MTAMRAPGRPPALRRRGWLALAAALLAGCGSLPGALRAQPLAEGVWWLPGARGAADAHNAGRIGNAGFIVGARGVLAVDTGSSRAHGQALLAAIGAVTAQPVVLAVVTQVRPEALFGSVAFRERGVPVAMHAQAAQLMLARCGHCLEALRDSVGAAALQGTTLAAPERRFETSHDVDLGGRTVRVLHLGPAGGVGDVAVLDLASGVLFAGGLLDTERVPDLRDADPAGWLRALDALAALPVSRLVPGHGPVSAPGPAIEALRHYLARLDARARELLAQGVTLFEAAEACALPEFAHWDQYEPLHRRNAALAYLRAERALLFDAAPAAPAAAAEPR